jgi:glyoxylase-like metal-dependent hydrolase (beta-lactamase superfamily II)
MKGPVKIADGIYGLGSELVNWYLVEDGGRLTAVDAGLPKFHETLEADLRTIGHAPGDVDAVVLTHSDSDHTGVVRPLREAGARVLIHAADDQTLRKPGPKKGDAAPPRALPRVAWRWRFWRVIGHMARGGGGKPPKIEGAETFADGDVLDVPGRPRAIHTPGHTDGHSVLLFEGRNTLFVGDALCTVNFLTGRPGPQVMPGPTNVSTSQARESLAAIEPLDAKLLLPGHGEGWHGTPRAAVAQARAAAGRS